VYEESHRRGKPVRREDAAARLAATPEMNYIGRVDPQSKTAGRGGEKSKAKAFARDPKQDRSRASFERVLDTAAKLLEEKGYANFTLSDLSKRSKVSIGSIYGRVNSKDDLIRLVQVRLLEQYELEFAALVNRIRRRPMPLRELIPAVVRELGEFLRRHSAGLNAFIQIGNFDPIVETTGKGAHRQTALDVKLLLLERRSEIQHPDPEHAIEACYSVVYSSIARHLGLGARDAAGEGEWDRLLEDLGQMALLFLLVDPRQLEKSDRRRG
jgi:AcrR family transcriptional regulator